GGPEEVSEAGDVWEVSDVSGWGGGAGETAGGGARVCAAPPAWILGEKAMVSKPPGDGEAEHRLPFGRYQGASPRQVPTGYLAWLLRNCKLSTGLREAVRSELLSRPDCPAELPPGPGRGPAPSSCRRRGGGAVRGGRREHGGGGGGGGRGPRRPCRRRRVRAVRGLPAQDAGERRPGRRRPVADGVAGRAGACRGRGGQPGPPRPPGGGRAVREGVRRAALAGPAAPASAAAAPGGPRGM